MGVSGISSIGQGTAYTYSAPEPVKTEAKPVEPLAGQKSAEPDVSYDSIVNTASAEKAESKPEGHNDNKQVEALVRLSKQIKGATLSFSYHEKTHRVMFKMTDDATNEVIREVPAEKVLDALASMLEAAGVFVDEKR